MDTQLPTHRFPSTWGIALVLVAALSRPDVSCGEKAIALARAAASEVVREGFLPGVTVGLVEGADLVWAEGFGVSDLEKRTPMGPKSIFRVGSISKLFTALAVMQLVEAGKLDLSRSLHEALPDLAIETPFAIPEPARLRHVLSHVSGLPRESPVGSYFDGSGAGPAEALASLRSAKMVHPPARVTKYSNIGFSLLGSAVEKGAGIGYVEYVEKNLLRPLGMGAAGFTRKGVPPETMATGYMQEGETGWKRAPEFELGTIAAGNLYAGVEDLAGLARMIHAGGELDGKRILKEETLREMSRVQFPECGRFGLGFVTGSRGGERTIEHSGAVYGFSTSFVCIPELKVTAIVLANGDVCMGPVRRIVRTLLDGVIAEKRGQAPPPSQSSSPEPAPAATPAELPGGAGALVFRSESPSPGGFSRLELRKGTRGLSLWIEAHIVPLEASGKDTWRTRGRLMDGNTVKIERAEDGQPAALTLDGNRFPRFDPSRAPAAPARWNELVGDYGPAYLPVRIRIREGRLVAECETFEYEPAPRDQKPREGEDPTFLFPRGTMYEDEILSFRRGPEGKVTALKLGTMEMERLR